MTTTFQQICTRVINISAKHKLKVKLVKLVNPPSAQHSRTSDSMFYPPTLCALQIVFMIMINHTCILKQAHKTPSYCSLARKPTGNLQLVSWLVFNGSFSTNRPHHAMSAQEINPTAYLF